MSERMCDIEIFLCDEMASVEAASAAGLSDELTWFGPHPSVTVERIEAAAKVKFGPTAWRAYAGQRSRRISQLERGGRATRRYFAEMARLGDDFELSPIPGPVPVEERSTLPPTLDDFIHSLNDGVSLAEQKVAKQNGISFDEWRAMRLEWLAAPDCDLHPELRRWRSAYWAKVERFKSEAAHHAVAVAS